MKYDPNGPDGHDCPMCGKWVYGDGPGDERCRECQQAQRSGDMNRKHAKEYLENPHFCPYCDSRDIEFQDLELDSEISQKVRCNECGRAWYDLYQLVGVGGTDEDGGIDDVYYKKDLDKDEEGAEAARGETDE